MTDAGRMTVTPRIRPMVRGDLAAVSDLETRVQAVPWSRDLFEAELAHDDRRYETAWNGPDVLSGFGGMWMSLEDAHITTVAVDPRHRRRGIATQLVAVLLGHAVAMGATAATLEVRSGNVAAQTLYRRFGFAPVGLRPRYYAGGADAADREDAIIMWVHDIDQTEFATTLSRVAARASRNVLTGRTA